MDRPADYLTSALGERPTKPRDRRKWNKAGSAIETYRHRHLGLTPTDGPLPGNGMTKAIGLRPSSLLGMKAWKQANDEAVRQRTQLENQEQPLRRVR